MLETGRLPTLNPTGINSAGDSAFEPDTIDVDVDDEVEEEEEDVVSRCIARS